MGSKSNKKIVRKASFKTAKKPRQHRRNWEIYPPPSQNPQNSRLVYGYYSNNTFCSEENCSQCSEEDYKANQPWPRPKRSSTRGSGRVNAKYVSSTTTTTKTLVSLKSCRSVSEIETLPPTGYFASTVVQHKQTYVNDSFVSDDEECYQVNSCCKER